MRLKVYYKGALLLFLTIVMIGCTEPYALQTNSFEEALVIEATLTNELKNQEVKISRTYKFEENGPTFETGADVLVTDDLGNEYLFEEQNGSYFSTIAFQAETGREYKLKITTSDGKTYSSTKQKLTTINQIESVVPTVVTNTQGQRGVQIAVNNFDPTNTSKYYRYEYEETYKIIAPNWKPVKAVVFPNDGIVGHPFIVLVDRTTEERICYSSVKSNELLFTSTTLQAEDRVSNFPVRFISNQDAIITNRYSILVKQYIQNLESYTFYKTLSEISGSGSILAQNQPGFFYGNMRSEDNPTEKVIGFFDVASVSSKRIFFNYEDLFPGEPTPPYFVDCTETEFTYCFNPPPAECDGTRLNGLVSSGAVVYNSNEGLIYKMVNRPCGECTSFSSNIRPLFWID